MMKVLRVVYLICSFHNIDSRELVDEQELPHEKSLLDSVDLVLSGPPCNVRSSREDFNSHYYVLTIQSMADAVALCVTR